MFIRMTDKLTHLIFKALVNYFRDMQVSCYPECHFDLPVFFAGYNYHAYSNLARAGINFLQVSDVSIK